MVYVKYKSFEVAMALEINISIMTLQLTSQCHAVAFRQYFIT